METVDTKLLQDIVQNTDSALLIFFVILAAVAGPVFYFLHKHNQHKHTAELERRKHDMEREGLLIQVVTANTEAMTGLKSAIETNNAAMKETVERIHVRIDSQSDTLQGISAAITRMVEQVMAMGKQARLKKTAI